MRRMTTMTTISRGGGDQPLGVHSSAVEDRDHDDRTDVIDDREGEQEQLESRWHPRPQEREDADREGDVGRHRDAPAAASVASEIHGNEDQGRERHSSESGEGRQRGRPPIAQLAVDDLALDLEADHEEEDGHQAVVDPMPQIEAQRGVAAADRDDMPPHILIRGRVDIRPDERDQRAREEDEARERLDGDERVAERRKEAACPRQMKALATSQGRPLARTAEVPTRLPGSPSRDSTNARPSRR